MEYRAGRNAEGYADPTASEAMREIAKKDRALRLVRALFSVAALAGFRVVGGICLEDRAGRVYRSDALLRRDG